MRFSIIIPVYNRPEELDELLLSLQKQEYGEKFEVIVVEDGSTMTSKSVADRYGSHIDIKYCFKKNSGPGDSRNYGMDRASGQYYILLDSDCILPASYMKNLSKALDTNYTDAYGGPDTAHENFTVLQKAINYSMTSFLTTGGLRSSESNSRKFQLRSFNMGLSKEAFEQTGGFSKQRIGEDIDLNFKLIQEGLSTQLIPEAFVYHKRRSSLKSFFLQTRNFGAARPVLNAMHKGSGKWAYWFPSLFMTGSLLALVLLGAGFYIPIFLFLVYLLLLFADAYVKTRDIFVAVTSLVTTVVQFYGYGYGFLRSQYRIRVQGLDVREAFPGMFA